jgi:flagellar FliL protein
MSEAPPAAAPPATDAAPKSKRKLLIIAAAAVVVAGGGGAFFLMKGGDEKPAAPKKAEAHKAPAQYIALEPPFVVNFDAGASARFLQVAVQLMTRDLEMAEFIKTHDPVIRNDLLLLLGNQKAEDVSTREGKEKLRAEALEAVRKILKSEGAESEKLEAVYFTSFVMQ